MKTAQYVPNNRNFIALIVLGVWLLIVSDPILAYTAPCNLMLDTNSTLPPGKQFLTSNGVSNFGAYPSAVSMPGNALSSGMNYVLTMTYLKPDGAQTKQDVTYYDALGRPMQIVQLWAAGDSGKDMVIPITYDAFGRQDREYLPYATATGIGGAFKWYATTQQAAFYNTPSSGVVQIAATGGATPSYGQTVYEASPLDRVAEQGYPGKVWQPDTFRTPTSGRTAVTVHTSNNTVPFESKATTRMVTRYVITGGSIPNNEHIYPAGELYVAIYRDENWQDYGALDFRTRLHTTEEYIDKQGHVVLTRTFDQTGSVENILSTYYVYNDLGQLCFVLPPGSYPDRINEPPPGPGLVETFGYEYHYDDRGRLVRKRLPGKGEEYLVYNGLNKVVATQDANQRAKVPEEWSVIKYDGLGRVVQTGLWDNVADLSIQGIRGAVQSQQIFNTWEERNVVGTSYTNRSWPTDNFAMQTEQFYDDYNVLDLPASYNKSAGHSKLIHGRPTVSRQRVLSTNDFLWSATYYNDRGDLVRNIKQHYLGGATSIAKFDDIYNEYTFTGQLAKSVRRHHTNNATVPAITITTEYEYDHRERRTHVWKKLDNTARILSVRNIYNDIGQLNTQKLHTDGIENLPEELTLGAVESVSNGQSSEKLASGVVILAPGFHAAMGSTFRAAIAGKSAQEIVYSYNERGWVASINNPLNITEQRRFGMKLYYANNPQSYNGNIGSVQWNTKVSSSQTQTPLQTYTYTYDQLNRLKKAVFSASGKDNYFNEELSYDVMGNIDTLRRSNGATSWHNLFKYHYDGNKLVTLTDAGMANRSNIFTYDANGNAKTNERLGITNTEYNYLNLPNRFVKGSQNLVFTYDATGRKLRKVLESAVTDYIEGIQYRNGVIEFIQTEEGRILPNGSSFVYEYFLKDHLGNTRAVVDHTGAVKQIQDYYAFGMEMNTGGGLNSTSNYYKYNGKENQAELGLNQLDYGARFYDAEIGRWNVVDPLAESYYNLSPYNYTNNNPIRFIDPDGRYFREYDDEDAYYADNPNGKLDGSDGHWLKSDRENRTNVWGKANEVNLQKGNGYNEYSTISQRRDFYGWFADKIDAKGFDNNWPGAANIVAGQMSNMDNPLIAWWAGDDVVSFANAGNKAIFNDVFDNLRDLYNGPVMKGATAEAWDAATLRNEQFNVVQPLYEQQSASTISVLSKMSKGQSIYGPGFTGALRFEGNLLKAQDRYNHGAGKVTNFYKLQQSYKKAGWQRAY